MCFSSSALVRNVLLQIAQDFLVGVLRFENSRPSFILVSSLLMSRILASMAATFSNNLVSLVAFSSSKTLASNALILAPALRNASSTLSGDPAGRGGG